MAASPTMGKECRPRNAGPLSFLKVFGTPAALGMASLSMLRGEVEWRNETVTVSPSAIGSSMSTMRMWSKVSGLPV